MKKEGYTQNVPVKQLIKEIQSFDLSEAEAMKLFVLISGLPKAGKLDNLGGWFSVGTVGFFVFSEAINGKVECFRFGDNGAGFVPFSDDDAFPSFTSKS